MTTRHWVISTYETGTRRDVELIVYGSLGVLRRESTRFATVIRNDADFHDTLAVCHGYERFHINADGTDFVYPQVATIRLAVGHVTPLIVSHEIAHAAQHIYGLDLDETEPVGEHFNSGNETFAGLLGELFNTAWTALSDAGLIDEEA